MSRSSFSEIRVGANVLGSPGESNANRIGSRDKGRAYTVRDEAVNVMLLNEFLKEHKTVQEQAATIAGPQKQLEALTTGLRKVSAQRR